VPDHRGRRLVPRRFDAAPELEAVAERLGWPPVDPGAGDGWLRGWRATPDTLVTWWEDPETDVGYAVVDGPQAPAADAAIRDGTDVLGPDGYAAAVAGEHTPMGRGHMLLAVAMAAPAAPDATVGAVMAEALADDNPYVRRYALLAAGVLGWDDLLAAAAAIATTDPEPAVRATAAEVLADR
jgi:hypothetical protein